MAMCIYLLIAALLVGFTVLFAAATRHWDTPKIVKLKGRRNGDNWIFTLEEGDPDEEGQAWAVFIDEELEG